MDNLARLRHTQQRIVRVQRRVWVAQIIMWPTMIAAATVSIAGVVWFVRSRHTQGGRHQLPDSPGAHEAWT